MYLSLILLSKILKERAFFFNPKKELKCSFFEFFATYETQKEYCVLFKRMHILSKERMPIAQPCLKHKGGTTKYFVYKYYTLWSLLVRMKYRFQM